MYGGATCAVAAGACTFIAPAAAEYGATVFYTGTASFMGSSTAQTPVTTIPQPMYSLAEGATGPFFDSYLLIANPNSSPAPVAIRFLRDQGAPVVLQHEIPASGRVAVLLNEVPGLESSSFAIEVRSPGGGELGVERAMYFAAGPSGPRAGHVTEAIRGDAPAPTVSPIVVHGQIPSDPDAHVAFAEGSNHAPFQTYLLMMNPGLPASAQITYLLDDAPPITQTVQIPQEGRLTVDTATVPGLEHRSFGITVDAARGVLVERARYLTSQPGALSHGGHAGGARNILDGVTRYLAEGATLGGFSTYLLLSNGQPFAAQATVVYHTAEGEEITRTHLVPSSGRVTIDVAAEDSRLRDTTFWTEVAGATAIARDVTARKAARRCARPGSTSR